MTKLISLFVLSLVTLPALAIENGHRVDCINSVRGETLVLYVTERDKHGWVEIRDRILSPDSKPIHYTQDSVQIDMNKLGRYVIDLYDLKTNTKLESYEFQADITTGRIVPGWYIDQGSREDLACRIVR
ncbi:MAG: hypothetical protein KF799_02595 [Bdellovibrionales bacterium]|nr:hypothetical protein [Bdellovibrionales bacterium]